MPRNELHELLENNPFVGVLEVQALIEKYPDAVKEKDEDGELPLHIAARNGASKEVIQLLIKEYPDAANEKDKDGHLPLTLLGTKGTKERVDNVNSTQDKQESSVDESDAVQKNSIFQGLRGDHPKGKDLLGVEEEVQAIADTITYKDLKPPFVVGILGGWGSGKSFTFNLILEHLKEIQGYDLETEAVKDNFPYVGHIYPIVFSAWTYAMSILWASIMHRILTVLNDQLDLEAAIGPELLKQGVSVIALMNEFTTSGERKYLKEVMKDKRVQQTLLDWEPKGGNITEALIHATNSNYDDDLKKLEEKRQQLYCSLALEEVTAKKNTTFIPEIQKLLKDAYKNYAEENPKNPIPQTVDAAMNSMKQYKGTFGRFKRYWDLLRAGRLPLLWYAVFLFSLILAVVIPYFLGRFDAIATAIGPLVSVIYAVINKAREKLRSAHAEIAKVASEMHLDKEKVQKALEAADGAQLRSDTNDEEKQQTNKEKKQKSLRGLNAEINALEDSVWLREGDSLKKVVGDRLGSSNYEEHLGIVHQAQKDLQHISDAMLSRNHKESFPRGDPRIVLFIDDLDRCPPNKVVETLEAVQLLVKTELFVVVLAIDAKYVTLCLENHYVDILHPERQPSGMDYIEKIIQIPYRVPPISAEYMKSFLQDQMNAKKNDETSKPSDSKEVSDALNGVAQSPSDNTADEISRDEFVPVPFHELVFTMGELELLEDACVLSSVGPRSGRRLVNVFTLMKIIWWYRGLDSRAKDIHTYIHRHEVSMKEASVWILVLCASSSRNVRREMCKVLAKIEKTASRPACGNLKSFIKNALGEIESDQIDDSPLTMICHEKCNKIFEKVKWEDDDQWKLVKNDLRLVRSFSFVGEYNEPVIHRRPYGRHETHQEYGEGSNFVG